MTSTTIGVAIEVPEPWGGRLQFYRTSLGDLPAPSIPTHITLVPPLEAEPESMDEVERHLAEAATRTSAFRVHLRGTGTFRPASPVVFVALAEGISDCEQLAASVRRGPLAAETRFPYHPHVTVAHGVSQEQLDRAFTELDDFECEFLVDRFSLYVHADGSGWKPVREFQLA